MDLFQVDLSARAEADGSRLIVISAYRLNSRITPDALIAINSRIVASRNLRIN